MAITVYIDADACPVKEDTFKVSKRYNLRVVVVSHLPIVVPRADWIEPVVVETGFDAVDDWIESRVDRNAIVVTNDLLLADRCIKKEARVIDPRGKILDENNIGEALAHRELSAELRQMGMMNLGPKKMGKNHRSNFLSNFDRLINAALR